MALTATVFNVDLTRRTVTTEREGRALFERALGDPALVLWNTRDMVRHWATCVPKALRSSLKVFTACARKAKSR